MFNNNNNNRSDGGKFTSTGFTAVFRNQMNGGQSTPEEIIETVYEALREKGYDPMMQIVGYLMSGDPTYITSFKNARSLITRLERDEIMEMFAEAWASQHNLIKRR